MNLSNYNNNMLNNQINDYKILGNIYEAIQKNNKESVVYLTNELIKNQTDESRVESLKNLIYSIQNL